MTCEEPPFGQSAAQPENVNTGNVVAQIGLVPKGLPWRRARSKAWKVLRVWLEVMCCLSCSAEVFRLYGRYLRWWVGGKIT